MFGLQHGAFAHTEQQAIKGPKMHVSDYIDTTLCV